MTCSLHLVPHFLWVLCSIRLVQWGWGCREGGGLSGRLFVLCFHLGRNNTDGASTCYMPLIPEPGRLHLKAGGLSIRMKPSIFTAMPAKYLKRLWKPFKKRLCVCVCGGSVCQGCMGRGNYLLAWISLLSLAKLIHNNRPNVFRDCRTARVHERRGLLSSLFTGCCFCCC